MPFDQPRAAPVPCEQHLFQPGHAATARLFLRRGWPATYVAVCVLCGRGVDLVALLRRAGPDPR